MRYFISSWDVIYWTFVMGKRTWQALMDVQCEEEGLAPGSEFRIVIRFKFDKPEAAGSDILLMREVADV